MSKKKDKPAKGKKGKTPAADDGAIRIGAHPRARRGVRRARAWAGIVGFAVAWLLAGAAGVPQFEALLRALGAGLALHFAAWAFAIALWRRLLVAELEVARQRVEDAAAPRAG